MIKRFTYVSTRFYCNCQDRKHRISILIDVEELSRTTDFDVSMFRCLTSYFQDRKHRISILIDVEEHLGSVISITSKFQLNCSHYSNNPFFLASASRERHMTGGVNFCVHNYKIRQSYESINPKRKC
jgi:hypothetical protein